MKMMVTMKMGTKTKMMNTMMDMRMNTMMATMMEMKMKMRSDAMMEMRMNRNMEMMTRTKKAITMTTMTMTTTMKTTTAMTTTIAMKTRFHESLHSMWAHKSMATERAQKQMQPKYIHRPTRVDLHKKAMGWCSRNIYMVQLGDNTSTRRPYMCWP